MNFEDKANESKKRTNIITGINIDWQFAQQIIPLILNKTDSDQEVTTAEFKLHCADLSKICTNIEEGIKELKSMLSRFNG